ncbi:MAG: histidinol dehydrogenase [Chloroflexaceae bacterium]|jgi:sulfopropanediol 3-dehydrogenase|nr:histidinol dehydrogenase [Chloroflexaceae bacterium]
MRTYLKQAPPISLAATAEVQATVAEIITHVRDGGESAVRDYSRRFDRWDPPTFRVSDEEIRAASTSLPETLKDDIAFAQAQVRRFAEVQREMFRDFEIETLPGVVLGQRCIPISNAGAYVPGGHYPLIASAYMSILTAKVAGVERVIACAPPQNGQGIHPPTLHAIASSGADEIYCIGGVQALAAMAYGTESIRPVDVLVGPGNAYVAEAKRQLFGQVGIDLIAGPTEILIIADAQADPVVVAADLLGQAEHGPTSQALLISTSHVLAEQVLAEIERQLEALPTAAVAGACWRNRGEIVVVESDDEAVALADEYAPEHLEVLTAHPEWYAQRLRNYGSLFLGEETTVAYGDKAVGTNHILPTGGAARYTGGLWVGRYIKVVTSQRLTQEGSMQIAPVTARICEAEGMLAHAITAELRYRRYG